MRKGDKKPVDLPPVLLDAKAASQLLSVGLTLFYSLDQRAEIPQAIKLGSQKYWSREQLEAWARASGPHRDSDKWKILLKELSKL